LATLNIGCGVRPVEGATNHDFIIHDSWVDVAHDLEVFPWPWQDGEWDKVMAFDVLEHLDTHKWVWLDELWRILKPGGIAVLHLPAWNTPESWRDPTHEGRVFHEETFYYWQPGHMLHESFGRYYKHLAEKKQWWQVLDVRRDYPEQNYGDIGYVLRKIGQNDNAKP